MSVYEYEVENLNGTSVSLDKYQGKVMLIFNSATRCGFTPQYDELQKLYDRHKAEGFEVLEFPCNQFGQQAPGTDSEIATYCQVHFGLTFPRFKKIDVNGEHEIPLYSYLKHEQGFHGFGKSHGLGNKLKGLAMKAMLAVTKPGYKESSDIKWNFTKFVIDREGNVVARFEPTQDMAEVESCIEKLLQKAA